MANFGSIIISGEIRKEFIAASGEVFGPVLDMVAK